MAVAETCRRFKGIYVDANAVSPSTRTHDALDLISHAGTVRTMADMLSASSFVDGSIIGEPPASPGLPHTHRTSQNAALIQTLLRISSGLQARRGCTCRARGPMRWRVCLRVRCWRRV